MCGTAEWGQGVKLLFKKGMSCFRERRAGSRKRKSVRGCIVGPDLAIMNLVVAKKGAEEVPGLTDEPRPRRLGPKRASNIRKLFNLQKKAILNSNSIFEIFKCAHEHIPCIKSAFTAI